MFKCLSSICPILPSGCKKTTNDNLHKYTDRSSTGRSEFLGIHNPPLVCFTFRAFSFSSAASIIFSVLQCFLFSRKAFCTVMSWSTGSLVQWRKEVVSSKRHKGYDKASGLFFFSSSCFHLNSLNSWAPALNCCTTEPHWRKGSGRHLERHQAFPQSRKKSHCPIHVPSPAKGCTGQRSHTDRSFHLRSSLQIPGAAWPIPPKMHFKCCQSQGSF